jgi:hypothetical protein
MVETYKSKVPYPLEVSEVSSDAVRILDDENYFSEQFDFPEQAQTLFYEKFASSLIQKFVDGSEIIWTESEFEKLVILASVEQSVNELEIMNLVDVFEDGSGEKIIVLKKTNTELAF